VNRHLDNRLGTSALEYNIKAFWGFELRKERLSSFFRPSELFIGGFRLVCGRGWWEAVCLRCEPVNPGEIETGGVDINGYDARGTSGLRNGTCKEANSATAVHEDGLTGGKIGSSGGMDDDGKWFGEGRLLERAVIRKSRRYEVSIYVICNRRKQWTYAWST
jgi:hypothetical protein